MDINESQLAEIQNLLSKLEELDPAELPEPAAELAELLGGILENTETA